MKRKSVNHARWIPAFSGSLYFYLSRQLFRKFGIFFNHSRLCLCLCRLMYKHFFPSSRGLRLGPYIIDMDISSRLLWFLLAISTKYKYRQSNIDRIHQRLLSVDCVRRASSPALVEGVLESENLASHSTIDVIQYIHDERWKPTLFSSVYIIVL